MHDALGHFETAAHLEDNKDHLAGLVWLLDRTSEAVPLAERLPKLTCDSFGTDSTEHGHLPQQASGLYRAQGGYDEAITALEEAVVISRAALEPEPEPPTTEKDSANLAGVQ